jgi:hypothetical protein
MGFEGERAGGGVYAGGAAHMSEAKCSISR